MKRIISTMVFLVMVLAVQSSLVQAQTTEFTYQGSLSTSGSPASGNYDFEFALFDALAGGTQIGSTLTRSTVAVANGTFAVSLDFGSQFPGANRFLEIRVRLSGGGGLTTLTPRQAVNSAPYSVRSLNSTTADTANTATTANNALNLGGVVANQYVQTTDLRLSDPRPPTAGSGNYVQNQNAGPQTTSNFNISGNGTAGGTLSGNAVNAFTQYNIGNSRVLSIAGFDNLFAGWGAGGGANTGFANSFVGTVAGSSNTTGSSNAFFGGFAGRANTTGSNNTFIGANSNVSAGNLTNATAIGSGAVVNASNKVRIGNINLTVIEGQVAYTFSSDKNLKENFLAVNGRDVLRKIRGFNMTSWNYIGQDAKAFRHYGPMAQDFYAAFGKDKFGAFGSPTTINSGDMAGVMLAAIKELSAENEAQKAEISEQRAVSGEQKKLIEEQQRQIDALLKANAAMSERLWAVEVRLRKK